MLPNGLFQEYCVAQTPLNTRLTNQLMPIDDEGMVAVPTEPGLGVTIDEEVLNYLRVDI